MLARALLTLVVLLTASLAGATARATASPPPSGGLGLPVVTWRAIHFRGNAMARTWDEYAIAVTQDSAIVETGDAESRRNRLLELPGGSGAPRVIGRHLTALAMADITGHRVFWTSKVAGGHRLQSYDTDTGVRHHVDSRGAWIVWAVDGPTAYVTPPSGSRSYAWTPGTPPRPLPIDDALVVSARGDTLMTVSDDSGVQTRSPDGSIVATGPPGWPIVGPSGAYAFLTRDRGDALWDLAAHRSVQLTGLGGRRAFDSRWAANGDLVVTAFRRAGLKHGPWDDDRHPVVHYRCSMRVGQTTAPCRRLAVPRPYRYGIGIPVNPSSVYQFALLLPYSRVAHPRPGF